MQELAFSTFPLAESVPLLKAERSEKYVARTLLGALASWASLQGVFDRGEVLQLLLERYPQLVWRPGGTFAEEVVRRHVMQPRAVRERNVQ